MKVTVPRGPTSRLVHLIAGGFDSAQEIDGRRRRRARPGLEFTSQNACHVRHRQAETARLVIGRHVRQWSRVA